MIEIDGKRYLSSNETAQRFGLAPGTFATYRSQRKIVLTPMRLGTAAYYEADAVEAAVRRLHR